MLNLGTSAQAIPQAFYALLSCGARLGGRLTFAGREFDVRHAPNSTLFIDVPANPSPKWAEFFRAAGLRSTTARQLSSGYAEAIQAVRGGVKKPIEKELLSHIIFSGADLTSAVFRATDFSGLKLPGANLHGARFEKCDFTKTDLSGAKLAGCVFVDCMFNQSDLCGVEAQKAVFSRCIFENALLPDAKLHSAKFVKCHCVATSFEFSLLENACISDCYMFNVGFAYADARGARFSQINVFMPDGVERPGIRDSFFISFNETILHNTVFDLCDLQGSIFMTYRGENLTMTRCSVFGGYFIQLENEPNVDDLTRESKFLYRNPCHPQSPEIPCGIPPEWRARLGLPAPVTAAPLQFGQLSQQRQFDTPQACQYE